MIINLDEWEKLPTQKDVYYDDEHETIMMSSGLGSGKSFVLVKKILKYSAVNQHVAGGLLAPAYSDYKRDIEPLLESELRDNLGMKEGVHYKYNRSEKTWKFCWSKAPLYVFTADRPIAGPNLGWGGVNEFSLVPKERINEFLRRIRVKDVKLKQKLLVGTPEDTYGWLQEFISQYSSMNESGAKKFKIYNSSTSENIFIDEDYVRHLTATLDDQALKVFLSGQIIRLGGDYFYYAFDERFNVDKDVQRVKDIPVCIGLDFNVGRMSATCWQHNKRESWCFQEIVLRGNSDTREMGAKIMEIFGDKVILYPDASAKARKTSGISDLEELKRMGFQDIRFMSKNPTLRDRQLAMNARFQKKLIRIHPSCKELIRDYKSVRQKEDFTKDKKNPDLTHTSDSADYFHSYEFPFRIERTSSTIQL